MASLYRLMGITVLFMGTMMLIFAFRVTHLSHTDHVPANNAYIRGAQTAPVAAVPPATVKDAHWDTQEDVGAQPQPNLVVTPKMKIAFAITVTKDGPYLDGAAVLKQSFLSTNPQVDYDFVAIVHKGVQSTRDGLRKLGFIIREFAPPILASEIRGKYLSKEIDKTGCCGSMELLKLRSFQLTEYDRVLLLDLDAMIVQNIDHLFTEVSKDTSALFTYDHAMDSPRSAAPPVQGGFFVITPSNDVYEEIVEVVREGDFRPGTGWGGSNIGWCWGGQTIQGVVSYYYNVVAKKGAGKEVNHCVYNSMATTEDCRHMDWGDIKTVHFTYCQKPWECHKGRKICSYYHEHWWKMRALFEQSHGLAVTPRCCADKSVCPTNHYSNIKFDEMVSQAS